MNSESPAYFYSLISRDFFESLEAYKPSKAFREIVETDLDPSWGIVETGFWSQCTPDTAIPIAQGWKIHISATPSSAPEVLRRVVPILASLKLSFKYCADPLMLELSLNKNWPRTGAGKFMAVYPSDDGMFYECIARCHEATKGLWGPYVLTDRPYKESRVVYYRYGEHHGHPSVNPLGFRRSILIGPDGAVLPDDRPPHFTLPPWVSDPFSSSPLPEKPGPDGVMLAGRYRVQAALRFSSVGGIYTAEDTRTGERVLIKEARPLCDDASRFDGKRLLEKEARLLKRLERAGHFARFIELFEEWEHLFLVQELLDAESLWGYGINILHRDGATPASTTRQLVDTIGAIATALQDAHDCGVVLRDLTRNNVMFTKQDAVRFVDLEFAYELDRDDPPVAGFTPGYASHEQLLNLRPVPAEDHYALGVLVLDLLSFTAPGYDLNRPGLLKFLDLLLAEYRLPIEFADLVSGLTADLESRWDIGTLLERLNSIPVPDDHAAMIAHLGAPKRAPAVKEESRRQIQNTVTGIATFIHRQTSLSRHDRLWPASGEVFLTNPASVQFGAAGIAWFLLRQDGRVSDVILDWVCAHVKSRTCPGGLYVGLSGIAWFLLEAGRPDVAMTVLNEARQVTTLYEAPGLYYGAAGWGLANLKMWLATGREQYLGQAKEVGEWFRQHVVTQPQGACWLEPNGVISLGFGHGQSGVATFLMYLSQVVEEQKYLDLAVEALRFELANKYQVSQALLWYPEVDSPVWAPKSPHMRHGSAGVGSALLRAYALTGDREFLEYADLCVQACSFRGTNKLWQDYGMAGWGEFLMDAHNILGNDEYQRVGFSLAEAIIVHAIPRDGGIAFLGSEMLKLSCDYGVGSAGIGIFLQRLLNPHLPRLMMLDEVLPNGDQKSPRDSYRTNRSADSLLTPGLARLNG